MKTCSQCHKEKPSSDFYKHKKYSDGLQNPCKECHKQNYTHTEKGRKQSVARTLKFNKTSKALVFELRKNPCNDCGQTYPPGIMQFHHLDSKKKESGVSSLYGKSRKRLFEEIDKCILLCPNCHALRHLNSLV